MEKSVLTSFINKLKDAGIEKYMLRIEGGNRTIEHGTDSCRLFFLGEYVLGLETKNNYGADKAAFNVKVVPYENVDNAASMDLTTKETLDFLAAEGIDLDEDTENFIKSHGARIQIQPGNAGYGVPVDEDGNPILANNKLPKVTTGFSV